MAVSQISNISPVIEQIKPVKQTEETQEASFRKVLQSVIDNVQETEQTAKQDELLLATGQVDDLHTVMINASKAELALSLLVQVRNKALDAYNDVMKMTL